MMPESYSKFHSTWVHVIGDRHRIESLENDLTNDSSNDELLGELWNNICYELLGDRTLSPNEREIYMRRLDTIILSFTNLALKANYEIRMEQFRSLIDQV